MKYIVFMHIHVQSSVEGIFIFRRLQLSSNAYELQEHFFLASKIPSIIHMNWVKECKAYMYFFIAAGYLKEGNKLSSFSNLSVFHSLLTWIPTKFSCILNYCWYLIRKGLYWWLHHWSWATYTLHCIWKKNQENLKFTTSFIQDIIMLWRYKTTWQVTRNNTFTPVCIPEFEGWKSDEREREKIVYQGSIFAVLRC